MGIILSRLRSNPAPDVFVDFENAKPTDNEMAIYLRVNSVLENSDNIIAELQRYNGCAEQVRVAMSQPNARNELDAFNALLPAIQSISRFYHYSQSLEQVVPELLRTLSTDESSSKQTFEDQQSLAVQLARVLNFALTFDGIRLTKPQLSNDLSFYRRLVVKFSADPRISVSDDEVSSISMWSAEVVPMISSLARAASATLQSNQYVTVALSTMANCCRQLIESKKFVRYDTNLFIARAMVGSIIIYDHLSNSFRKDNATKTKKAVQLIKNEFPDQKQGLLDALHFSTKNFKDASQKLQDMFT